MLQLLLKLFGQKASLDAGGQGERLAAAWLQRERGFTIVTQNWRNPRDRREEIDVVCRDGEALVFVEVKTRAVGALVPGYYAVDARKKRVVQRAARSYLAQLRERPKTFRFDIVEVVLAASDVGAKAPEILHFQNVKLFSKYFRA